MSSSRKISSTKSDDWDNVDDVLLAGDSEYLFDYERIGKKLGIQETKPSKNISEDEGNDGDILSEYEHIASELGVEGYDFTNDVLLGNDDDTDFPQDYERISRELDVLKSANNKSSEAADNESSFNILSDYARIIASLDAQARREITKTNNGNFYVPDVFASSDSSLMENTWGYDYAAVLAALERGEIAEFSPADANTTNFRSELDETTSSPAELLEKWRHRITYPPSMLWEREILESGARRDSLREEKRESTWKTLVRNLRGVKRDLRILVLFSLAVCVVEFGKGD